MKLLISSILHHIISHSASPVHRYFARKIMHMNDEYICIYIYTYVCIYIYINNIFIYIYTYRGMLGILDHQLYWTIDRPSLRYRR